eukprot:tig00020912_g15792.t1
MNFWFRVNAILTFAVSCLSVMLLFCSLSTRFIPSNPQLHALSANVAQLRRGVSMTPHSHSQQSNDQAVLIFNVSADLSSLFNWNVKQLFIYITAEYSTETHPSNQVVLWDRIITKQEQAKLRLTNEPNKYILVDQGFGLRATAINLTLNWNVMPYTGMLWASRSGSQRISMPTDYSTGAPPQFIRMPKQQQKSV